MPLDLSSPGLTVAVQKRIAEQIDQFCKTKYDGGHRSHLGASLIGDECSRRLWYVFRWVKSEEFNGRMQRLFNRGHREEARFVEWLRGIGCQVWTEDTSAQCGENGEYPQFRISGVGGHFGGSLDGVAILPPEYDIQEPVLLEFKTNATGRAFSDLIAYGMEKQKPVHFAQTSTYGYKGVKGTQFRFCLYLNINKNDDDLHVELVKLNHSLGQQMEAKAERIILARKAPARLSDNPTFHKCQYCNFHAICHKGAVAEMNCRSCKHAVPVENAQWVCEHTGETLAKEALRTHCKSYSSITQNV